MPRLPALLLLALVLSSGTADARRRSGPRPGGSGRPFDYYLLALSWSPAYCAERGGDSPDQCGSGRQFGFIVHGLWPQYEPAGYPEFCQRSGPVPPELVERMMPITPSRKLIVHEWEKHGTCTGLSVTDYFARVQEAFAKVRVPPRLVRPRQPVSADVAEIERLFAEANPGLGGSMMAVMCRRQYVAEIRLCLDKELRFRPCGEDVRDDCRGTAIFRPIK